MNRSIFIVIVDFLLLSLIAFARFDSDPAEPVRQPQQASATLPNRQQDMMAVLKVSLDQERQARDQLNQQLNQTQAALKTREELLSEREARMRQTQQDLQKKAEEAQQLAQERAAIESQFNQTRASLSTIQQQMLRSSNETQLSRQQLAAMEADLRKRQEELSGALSEAQFSKERLASMEADLRKRQEAFEAANSEARVAKGVLEALQDDLRKQNQQALSLQENMAKLEQERTATEAEKQLLASRLQVVDTERKIAREQVEHMKGEVQAERTEKARLMDTTTKLTEGVNSLAQKSETLVKNTENLAQKSEALVKNSENLAKSSENIAQKTEALRQDIQQNRPIAPNTFYAEFLTNRVISSVVASRPGLIGRVDRNTDANSVLITDGTNYYALTHIEETPLAFAVPGTDWDRLMITLRNNRQMVSAAEMWFWGYDPRVIIVPVDPVRAKALGVKAYPVAHEPHKFQEAIVIGAKDNYYGECRFSLEVDRPQYLRMDRNFLKRLAGNFSPSRGDMVFGKNGQLLGVMVNDDYCALVNNFTALYSFRAGVVINDQKTGTKLAAMRLLLDQLPFKMQ